MGTEHEDGGKARIITITEVFRLTLIRVVRQENCYETRTGDRCPTVFKTISTRNVLERPYLALIDKDSGIS